ncbi:hypothetical protein CYMTET_13622 [Cymbomonas tetramitiformis]|uniref:Uncharacterized protein n=1 Tax=Cymbomonas tetramitiformis TaxID=36881 RepID=A0AAE0GHR2_9CHLO|nr:hypothetical protein CYMTET_13622 [Cymbomonas tetramitiformis]
MKCIIYWYVCLLSLDALVSIASANYTYTDFNKYQRATKLFFRLRANLSEHELRFPVSDDFHRGPVKLPECGLRSGCVAPEKLNRFLAEKWIPGRELREEESIFLDPKFSDERAQIERGHFFEPAGHTYLTLLVEFLTYLRTRPRKAVPDQVADMIVEPTNTSTIQWPGDRHQRPFYTPQGPMNLFPGRPREHKPNLTVVRLRRQKHHESLLGTDPRLEEQYTETDLVPYVTNLCDVMCRAKALFEAGYLEYEEQLERGNSNTTGKPVADATEKDKVNETYQTDWREVQMKRIRQKDKYTSLVAQQMADTYSSEGILRGPAQMIEFMHWSVTVLYFFSQSFPVAAAVIGSIFLVLVAYHIYQYYMSSWPVRRPRAVDTRTRRPLVLGPR